MQDDTPTAIDPPAALEDELIEHELPPRPRRRLLGAGANPLGVALLCALLTVCGFIGGVLVEKGEAQPSSPASGAGALASRLSALRGGGGAGNRGGEGARLAGAGGGGGGGGAPTVGQVSYVSGHTLYVTDFEGNTVKVTASAGATVTRTVKAALKAIRPGETVIVIGSAGRNGAIRAQSIRASESAGGGLGALFGGGGTSPRSGSREGGGEGPVLFGK